MEIIIDPRCRINYASYYLLGIKNTCGKIKFNIQNFKHLPEYHGGIWFLIVNNNQKKYVFIDYHDSQAIIEDIYEKCDLYAKINIKADININDRNKLFPIGPSFGVQLWNYSTLFLKFIFNYLQCIGQTKMSFKQYLQDYLYMNIRRDKYINYHSHTQVINDNVFTINMLWQHSAKEVHKFDVDVNKYRKEFILVCKKLGLNFEGGFFYIPNKDKQKQAEIEKEYEGCLAKTTRISLKEYIEKTKKSVFVFNTPSVWGCHGWKLAEYLCMGKAIISTPLNNIMPGEFKDRVHYHLVHNESEIEDAIKLLRRDAEYRNLLERNAKQYFDKYLAPDVVIKRIVEKCF